MIKAPKVRVSTTQFYPNICCKSKSWITCSGVCEQVGKPRWRWRRGRRGGGGGGRREGGELGICSRASCGQVCLRNIIVNGSFTFPCFRYHILQQKSKKVDLGDQLGRRGLKNTIKPDLHTICNKCLSSTSGCSYWIQLALFTDCQGLGCLGLSAACVKGRQMSPGRMGRRRVGAAQIQVYSWTTGSLGAAGHCKVQSCVRS